MLGAVILWINGGSLSSTTPMCFSITLRYMTSREEAEEVLNDVFIKVLDKLDQYDDGYPLRGWIRKIAINTAIDRIRSQSRFPSWVQLTGFLSEALADDQPVFWEEDQQVLPMIQELPPRYRAVFNLRVFEDYTHKEIAALLRISVGTSKSNYARAKQILKKSLERRSSNREEQKVYLLFKGDLQ